VNSDTIAIISDVHGCFKTLMSLVKKLPPSAEVILCGDLVDRGPDSKGVVEWAMKNKIRCVLGNHDHMLIDYCVNQDRPAYGQNVWFANGGLECMRSFGGKSIPEKVVQWFRSLPWYIKEKDGLFISHTGKGDHPDWIISLWHRYTDDGGFPSDGKYRVFGHTVVKKAEITDEWAAIDTGAAYSKNGYGKMTAFLWPSRQTIVEDYHG
jgi:serine/threonine protein phosphatase 1